MDEINEKSAVSITRPNLANMPKCAPLQSVRDLSRYGRCEKDALLILQIFSDRVSNFALANGLVVVNVERSLGRRLDPVAAFLVFSLSR